MTKENGTANKTSYRVNDFKIEKGVPLPKNLGHRRLKYPWELLDVTDSFVVYDVPNDRKGNVRSVVSAANKRYAPKRFVQAPLPGKTNDIRIWRVE